MQDVNAQTLRNPRHLDILRIVNSRKQVAVTELTTRLSVSEVTVRKDLSLLEELGLLIRTRGGAMIAEDLDRLRPLHERSSVGLAEKDAIARAAADLVRDGDTVYIDAGTTCRHLARHIADRNIRVVTNSLEVLVELSDAPEIALFSIGGSLRREAGSFIGPIAIEGLRRFQLHVAFIGTTGVSWDGVLSSQNVLETEVKRAAIAAASRRILLADTAKFGVEAFSVFARKEDVDLLVTNDTEQHNNRIRAIGWEVTFVTPQSAAGD